MTGSPRALRVALLVTGSLACSKPGSVIPLDAAPSPGPSGGPSSSAVSRTAPTADTDNASVATMKLLEAGEPPRRKLRYTWGGRRGETLAMDLRTAASTEEGSNKQPEILLPPVRIIVAIDPQDVSPEGDLSYRWRVTSATVTADAQTPSSLAVGMRAEVAAVEHLSGTGLVTSRGLSTRVSIDALPPMGAGATGQMVEQVRQTLRDVAAPFPDEEVGLGARWERLSQLASRDARVTQTETFRLVDIGRDTGALDDLLAQTAPPQPLLSPGAAPGAASARIESMLTSGDGKTQFDRSRLVPQTKFDGTTTMVVSSHPQGEPQDHEGRRMTMIMRVTIVLAGNLR